MYYSLLCMQYLNPTQDLVCFFEGFKSLKSMQSFRVCGDASQHIQYVFFVSQIMTTTVPLVISYATGRMRIGRWFRQYLSVRFNATFIPRATPLFLRDCVYNMDSTISIAAPVCSRQTMYSSACIHFYS